MAERSKAPDSSFEENLLKRDSFYFFQLENFQVEIIQEENFQAAKYFRKKIFREGKISG